MADTYTDLSAQEQNISSLSSALASGISGLPAVNQALRSALYEREKTLPALESDYEGKIQELYTADKRYAERYANPESEMYLEDPMQRQALVSGQKADVRGELGSILNLIQQRSQVLGSALDKGMELYKYGLEAQKAELEAAEKAYARLWEKYTFGEEMAFKEKQLAKSGSGGGTLSERNKASAMQRLQNDIQSWTNLENLIRRYVASGELSESEVVQAYNTFHSQPGGWGAARVEEYGPGYTEGMSLGSQLQQWAEPTSYTYGTEPVYNDLGEKTGEKQYKINKQTGEKSYLNTPSPQEIYEAQSEIEKYSDSADRQSIYNQIISEDPRLEGFIFP